MDRFVLKMLAKKVKDRHKNTHELLAEFRNIKPYKEDAAERDRRIEARAGRALQAHARQVGPPGQSGRPSQAATAARESRYGPRRGGKEKETGRRRGRKEKGARRQAREEGGRGKGPAGRSVAAAVRRQPLPPLRRRPARAATGPADARLPGRLWLSGTHAARRIRSPVIRRVPAIRRCQAAILNRAAIRTRPGLSGYPAADTCPPAIRQAGYPPPQYADAAASDAPSAAAVRSRPAPGTRLSAPAYPARRREPPLMEINRGPPAAQPAVAPAAGRPAPAQAGLTEQQQLLQQLLGQPAGAPGVRRPSASGPRSSTSRACRRPVRICR